MTSLARSSLLALAVIVLWAAPANAAVAFVQCAVGTDTGSGPSTTTANFGSSVTGGNFLVVFVSSWDTDVATFTLSDTGSNTYTTSASYRQVNSLNQFVVQIFYKENATGGSSFNVTATADDDAYVNVVACEFSGVATSSSTDGTSTNTSTGTSATGGNIATTTAGVIVGVVSHNQSGTITPDGAWTEAHDGQAAAVPFSVIYRLEASGTYNATWTVPSAEWFVASAAFKEGAGGGPTCTGGLALLGAGRC